MGTTNFAYTNRCIVVTDDDYEMENLPQLGEHDKNINRNYPSRLLAVSDDFDFHNIVITSGYYADACIDYYRNEDFDGIEYFVGDSYYFGSKRQFFKECKESLSLTEYRLRKVCGNVKECSDFDTWLERAYERLNDYLAEIEERKVNTYLDGVKQTYGYEEIRLKGTFSNGGGVYEQVS